MLRFRKVIKISLNLGYLQNGEEKRMANMQVLELQNGRKFQNSAKYKYVVGKQPTNR